jgi:hypothetical protein
MATSKNVIHAKAGIQKSFKILDSRLLGSDKLVMIRGSHMNSDERVPGKECSVVNVGGYHEHHGRTRQKHYSNPIRYV